MKRELAGFLDQIDPRIVRIGSLIVLSGAAVGAGWYGMQWYVARKGSAAQLLMGDCMDEYRKAQVSKDSLWSEVELASTLAHTQAAGTALEPYFVMMQAQAYAAQGQIEKALEHVERALAELPVDSAYRSFFTVTQALIKLDAPSEDVAHAGLLQLQQLAAEERNWFADVAAYHVGEWYWLHDKMAEAKVAWQQLVDQPTLADSPWAELAKQKLMTL
jgi:tetratricopeptide (TPR) repeat protein